MMFALLVASTFLPPMFQSPDRLLPTEAYAFEYPDAALTAESIDRFEVSYDGAAFALHCRIVITPAPATDCVTASGVSMKPSAIVGKYKLIPPQTTGTHTFSLRACNLAGCGPASAPFAFAPLVSPTTGIGAITKIPR